jgi:SOS-response transcriptional repressor LexA
MNLKDVELEIVEVESEGYVAAGRTIPFPPPESSTLLALPPQLVQLAKQGMVKTMTITGNSLSGVGIYDGDEVVCKKTFSKKEIGRNTICIVYIPATGEVVAKKIDFRDDYLILRSCNADYPDMKVKPDDVDIRGIVIQLVRKPDFDGHFDRNYGDGGAPF